MRTNLREFCLVVVLSGMACGGGGSGSPSNSTEVTQVIGAAGGTVALAHGPGLTVPAGALPADTPITIRKSAVAPPSGALGALYEFGPAGTAFAKPVTVSFGAPGASAATIYWTRAGSTAEYDALSTALAGGSASAATSHFSLGFVGVACVPGAACTPSPACRARATDCSTGTPTCAETGEAAADGTSCGSSNACYAGSCLAVRSVAGQFLTATWPLGAQAPTATDLAPQPPGTTVAALVGGFSRDGDADGYVRISGTVAVDGTFSIPGVPVGHYLLELVQDGVPQLTERSADALTVTRVTAARSGVSYPTQSTTLKLTVENLDPWQPKGDTLMPDLFEVHGLQADLNGRPVGVNGLAAESTSYAGAEDWLAMEGSADAPIGLPDASKGDTVTFYQLHRREIGTGDTRGWARALTKAYATSSLTLADGGTADLDVPLEAVPQTGSINVDLRVTAYAALASAINPGTVITGREVGFAIFAAPQVALWNGGGEVLGRYLRLGVPLDNADAVYGTVHYGQALGSDYAEVIQALALYAVPLTFLDSTTEVLDGFFVGGNFVNAPPFDGVFTPVVGPVTAPLINGQSAFDTRTSVGTSPRLSWRPPSLGTPTYYNVVIGDYSGDPGAGPARLSARVAGTSFDVPSGFLTVGHEYAATITAVQTDWDVGDAEVRAASYPEHYADCATGIFSP